MHAQGSFTCQNAQLDVVFLLHEEPSGSRLQMWGDVKNNCLTKYDYRLINAVISNPITCTELHLLIHVLLAYVSQ